MDKMLTVEQINDRMYTLTGELDTLTAPVLERRIAEWTAAGTDAVTLNVAGLEFVDSAGLRSLLLLATTITTTLVQPQRMVLRLLTIADVLPLFTILPAPADGTT